MKKNVIALALSTLVLAAGANAAQGTGKVTFNGTIIDAPCSLASESEDQVVELGQVGASTLKAGGKSNPKDFEIKLENCDVTSLTEKKAGITFTGTNGAVDGALAITGTASGASVVLNNGSGGATQLKLGVEDKQTINTGNNVLLFSAYLQGNNNDATDPVTPGQFTSIAQFNMAYY